VRNLGGTVQGDDDYLLYMPGGIAWTRDPDEILVADEGNNRVQAFSLDDDVNETAHAFTLNGPAPKRGYVRRAAPPAADLGGDDDAKKPKLKRESAKEKAEREKAEKAEKEAKAKADAEDGEDGAPPPPPKPVRPPVWELREPTDVAARRAIDGLRAVGKARGLLHDWERDCPSWWLGAVNRSEAHATMQDAKVGTWRVRVDPSSRGDLLLCYVSHESYKHAEIDEHEIRSLTPERYWVGPFQAKVHPDVARRYYAKVDGVGARPRAISGAVDYALTVDRLSDLLPLLAAQHDLDYPLDGDPWGGRPFRVVAVADSGNDRVATFMYSCKRHALFDAQCRWIRDFRGDHGVALNGPTCVAWSRDGDLAVGDVRNKEDWSARLAGATAEEMRKTMADRRRVPGRVVVFGAPTGLVTSVVVLTDAKREVAVAPPLRGCATDADPTLVRSEDIFVAGAQGGGPPLVIFWGDGEADDGSSRPPRLAAVARGSRRLGPMVALSPPDLRRAGKLALLPQTFVESVVELLAFDGATATARLCCTSLAGVVAQLRAEWRLEPLTAKALSNAKALFARWARRRDGCAAVTSYVHFVPYATDEALELVRLQKSLADDPGAYALRERAKQRDADVAKRGRAVVEQEARDAALAEIARRRGGGLDQARDAAEDPEAATAYLDFSRGALCAVSEVYGGKFWWRWRGALAEEFADLAKVVSLSERVDLNARAAPSRLRSVETIASRVLDGDTFLEFWTRLEECRLGIRPWRSATDESPGGRLLLGLDDGARAAAAAVAVGAKRAGPSDQLASHLRRFDFQCLQATCAIDRILQRSVPLKGPGSSAVLRLTEGDTALARMPDVEAEQRGANLKATRGLREKGARRARLQVRRAPPPKAAGSMGNLFAAAAGI